MHIKLADEVTRQETIAVGVRPALHARKCDSCGTVFKMEPYCNDQDLGELVVTFHPTPGSNIGIMDVCSFRCAHELFTGGWRKVPSLKEFVDCDAKLVRARITVTSMVLSEALIRSKWQEVDHSESCKERALSMPSERIR